MQEKGIITKVSTQNFENTYQKLRQVIDQNPNLKIILELDHQANAAKVDLTLNPTRIILFGNPKLGTPLMLSAQSAGLDLPQKILVTENESGEVQVQYNDPLYLKQRHDISDRSPILEKISSALEKITNAAILHLVGNK